MRGFERIIMLVNALSMLYEAVEWLHGSRGVAEREALAAEGGGIEAALDALWNDRVRTASTSRTAWFPDSRRRSSSVRSTSRSGCGPKRVRRHSNRTSSLCSPSSRGAIPRDSGIGFSRARRDRNLAKFLATFSTGLSRLPEFSRVPR